MTAPIVIHAGFHKTGTTTVQKTLQANGPHLWPVMALGLKWKMKDALNLARAWSERRDDDTLARFSLRFAEFLSDLDLGKRGLLVSAEELAGHLPGRPGVPDYGAAQVLLPETLRLLRTAFPDRSMRVVLTTRKIDPWARSAYWEHVKASRMVDDFDVFRARLAVQSLEDEAKRIADAVAPVPLTVLPLETCEARPLGPAAPILELMGLSDERRALLEPVPRANERHGQEVLDHLLDLNRSDLSREDLSAAKRAYLAGLS